MPYPTSSPRRAAAAVAAVALVLAVSWSPGGVGAAPGDAREERERVRQERADLAAQLDVLEATDAQIAAALEALNANVAGQEAALADAQRAAEQAEVIAAEARAREASTLAEIEEQQALLSLLAVDAYMNAGTGDPSLALLQSDDLEVAAQRQALSEFGAMAYQDVLENLRALSEDLAIARQEAEAAAEAAAVHREEVALRLGELQVARDQQAAVAAEVDARIEHALAEAANLESLDAELSRQIAEEQARLAAQNRAGGGSSGGRRSVGNIEVVTVRGITVNVRIADQVEQLLAHAESDGIRFGGGGYRSSDSQIALRRSHCGTSDYAVYEMPASQCSPPTARPGQSMHEQGLAIDFTYNGRVISSRSNPGYQWLAAHAGSYGFRNLPSEPWHWSVNGQ